MSRSREDNTEYNGVDSLWIFTEIEGKWGAKLRSSYLSGSAQLHEAQKVQ